VRRDRDARAGVRITDHIRLFTACEAIVGRNSSGQFANARVAIAAS
jgi:hypothetical protein